MSDISLVRTYIVPCVVLVTQSCLTLCDPTDCSPPGFSVHGILQVRILEWIAIPFSRGTSPPRDWTLVSCLTGRFFTIWAILCPTYDKSLKDLNVMLKVYHIQCWYMGSMLCYAKSLQSCPTLCDPIDGSPPGPAVPGILQARTLEWVAISFSNAWKWKVKVKSLSRVRLLATPWIAA